MRDKEPCGCVHDGMSWLVQCPPHAAERAEYKQAFMEQRSVRAPDDITDLLGET